MKIIKKRSASILISALAIFILISTIGLLVYTYSSHNLKQAKEQEEKMHAYFLAYAGCEIAYAALDKEYKDFKPTDVNAKWQEYALQFEPTNTAFLNQHKFIISMNEEFKESGYISTPWQKHSGPNLVESDFPELKNTAILFKIDKVPDDADGLEEQYRGFIRIESIGKNGIGSSNSVEAKKFLYIDAKNFSKIFWR